MSDDDDPTLWSPLTDAVNAQLNSLRALGRLRETGNEALVRLAHELAGVLDAGAGMATAAVSKELRATLEALTEPEEDDDDTSSFLGAAQIRHPED